MQILVDSSVWIEYFTGAPSPEDSLEPGTEPVLENQRSFLVGGRSVLVLVGK